MTYLTKKHCLAGPCCAAPASPLGLPLLDAMIPAATALAGTAAAPKLRAGFFYIPHGAIMWNTPFGKEMDHWTPERRRRRLQAEPDPLAAREAQEVRHLVRRTSRTRRTQNSVHTIVPGDVAVGVRPDTSATGATWRDDRPDHRGEDRPGHRAAFARGRVRDDDAERRVRGTGGCYYSSTLSFRNATSPLPMEFNPRKVFMQLFGEGDTPEERDAIAQRRRRACST